MLVVRGRSLRPCLQRQRNWKTQLLRFDLPSTLIHHKNETFRKPALRNRRNLKTPALRFRVDGNLLKTDDVNSKMTGYCCVWNFFDVMCERCMNGAINRPRPIWLTTARPFLPEIACDADPFLFPGLLRIQLIANPWNSNLRNRNSSLRELPEITQFIFLRKSLKNCQRPTRLQDPLYQIP